jgi:hypothetical protein
VVVEYSNEKNIQFLQRKMLSHHCAKKRSKSPKQEAANYCHAEVSPNNVADFGYKKKFFVCALK